MSHFLKFHPLLWSVRPLDAGADKYAYIFRELMLGRYSVLIS